MHEARPATAIIYASQSGDPAQMALERSVVHMIIERETCLEALLQVTPHFHDPHSKVRPWKVIGNLTLQYRRASMDVVEGIGQWRALLGAPRQAFLWKHSNYLSKMVDDTASFASVPDMFRDCHGDLTLNPFLSPFALTDSLFDLDEPAMLAKARLAGSEIGGIDMDRICRASKVLLAEGVLQQRTKAATPAKTVPQSTPRTPKGQVTPTPPVESHDLAPHDKLMLMKVHLDHGRAKLRALEDDRASISERMAEITAKLEATTLPSKVRMLQNNLGALNNSLRAVSGEIFQRRNELTRQEATYRLQASKAKRPRPQIRDELHEVVAQDQKMRDELVAALARREPEPAVPALDAMNEAQVFAFVKDLGLDACAEKLKAMGIDGPLLAVSTDQDLQELGIEVRLHRVKILREVEKRLKDGQ
ncbi:hypothetical protein SDRG_01555 [Saprolegnia diclina VS20]|uniref:SAM domain-containing protein n=1 Tax=Saprolegnia diclina (strain VS20) TaxID=1156394 RepID=T0R5D8_SAPDV|nr:hypothetical protein SDRG_01555 [Saprolegnia diclina VS20]EQC41595.1 hypothetical protein SDRG_01555 [Saprolegnia diclina VS20]|eukprot:XP_008605309.1 hypothetical protein SDRG_01555 [Saprolegnia diclina VS20]